MPFDVRIDPMLAAQGFQQYRYRGRYGFVFIAARDTAEALREAMRSITGPADVSRLERLVSTGYEPVA